MKKRIGLLVAALAATAALSACDLSSSDATAKHHTSHHSGGAPTKAKKTKPPAPKYTVAQTNAIRSAKQYLAFQGFSRAGLIQQLSSKAGDGFKLADAVFAVNHITVDWNAEAVKSAKQYLKLEGFSRAGLIQQLSSAAGDGYTVAQATYAANHVGLR